jgi:hypothetical protein
VKIHRMLNRAADIIVAALVGGWWSPLIGAAVLAAIWYVAGLWTVLGIAAVGIGVAVWSARQLRLW